MSFKHTETAFKQVINISDKKKTKTQYHYCNILAKYCFLSCENLMKFSNVILSFWKGLAPLVLGEFVLANKITNTVGLQEVIQR